MVYGDKHRELLYRNGIFRNIDNRANSGVSKWGDRLRIVSRGGVIWPSG